MAAQFSRLKVWTAEVLDYAALNAEFDNILNNLSPTGISGYSQNLAQYQQVTSPLDTGGSPDLPTDLAGEITRLRYQILQILGADATNWYDQPTATLSGLAGIVFGNSVPATRIESISSPSYVNILTPNGSTTTVTLKGSTNNITYYINGVRYELTTDVILSGLSTAPTTGNTASSNDTLSSATHASTYISEHNTTWTLASVGANITSQAGLYQAYKVVRGGVTEYFTAYYNPTGTLLEKGQRGKFFLSTGLPSSRTQVNTGDTVTLQKLAWLFLVNDGSLTVTYNTPVWSFSAPTTPGIGDYWFDMVTTTWKVYSALGYNESNAVYVGQAVIDGTACVAARSQEPYRVYSTLNNFDITVSTDSLALVPRQLQSSLSVYGSTHYFGAKTERWDAASIDGGGTLGANIWYAYVKETADFVLSGLAPHDRRGDLGGYYHPSHSWRCVGWSGTAADLFGASVVSFARSGERTFFNNVTEPLSITNAMIATPSFSVSNSSGTTSNTTTSATPSDVNNLSVPLITTGKPVEIRVIGDNSAQACWQMTLDNTNVINGLLYVLRDGVQIDFIAIRGPVAGNSIRFPPSTVSTFDLTPSAGLHTYKIQYAIGLGQTFTAQGLRLLVKESN